MSIPLPEYERPPIEEVAIGVQFEPLAKMRAAHFGGFWLKIRDRYPNSEEQLPLDPQIEQEAPPVPAFAIRTGLIPLRCWFLDSTGNELIQLQRDRFLRNWRQIRGDEPYPRYSHLIERFKREWTGFLKFLDEESLGPPKVNQCELTYINHLEPGAGWKDYSELAKVFTVLREPGGGFLPEPELQSWESRYRFPEGKGRLHVQAVPVFRARDFKLILSLTLTARGAPGANSAENIFAWFDFAHEWVVRGFDQLTQSSMHHFWGKK
jgi:uncharacterized protein (TIGR04255 family)